MLESLSSRLCFSVPETASLLGISKGSVWNAIADGRLPVVKLGRRTLVRSGDIETWLTAASQGAKAAA